MQMKKSFIINPEHTNNIIVVAGYDSTSAALNLWDGDDIWHGYDLLVYEYQQNISFDALHNAATERFVWDEIRHQYA